MSANLLYYFSVSYNFIADKYAVTLQSLEALTSRVNKAILGEPAEWIIGANYCMRMADIAPSLRALCQGYVYYPDSGEFVEQGVRGAGADKKLMYIGGEYRLNTRTHDITDWMNAQRWAGKTAPSAKQIIMAWLIRTNQLGFMMTDAWEKSECMFVDGAGDDHTTKMET